MLDLFVRVILSGFLVIVSCCVSAAHDLTVYYEATDNGYDIYADNEEYCPMSILISFDLQNLKVDGGEGDDIYVIEARRSRQLIASLEIIDKRRPYKFHYEYTTNYGDHTLDHFDEDFEYSLPYLRGQSYRIDQGYDGRFSHKGKNALDFGMPIGSEIAAARSGTVIKVVDHHYKQCLEDRCKKFNNFIVIYHQDGTFAEYTHIKQYGSLVKVGDGVTSGQVIGFSGNVGYSSGPHLHLAIFQQKMNKKISLRTRFRIDDGNKAEYLMEKAFYQRNY